MNKSLPSSTVYSVHRYQHSFITANDLENEFHFSDLVSFNVTVESATDRCCYYQQFNPMTASRKYEAVIAPTERHFSSSNASTQGSLGTHPKSIPTVTFFNFYTLSRSDHNIMRDML